MIASAAQPSAHTGATTGTATATAKQLKIKTGTVMRFYKDLQAYTAEETKQRQKVEEMRALPDKYDEYDVRKQLEVLAETEQIIPDTRKRLHQSYKELADMVAAMSAPGQEDPSALPEFVAAQKLLGDIELP